MKELLEGEAFVHEGAGVLTSREWAATVLREVAEGAEAGMFPADVSAFDLGRAVARTLINCPEHAAFTQFARGIDHYLANAGRRRIPDSVIEILDRYLTGAGIEQWWQNYVRLDPLAQEQHANEHARRLVANLESGTIT